MRLAAGSPPRAGDEEARQSRPFARAEALLELGRPRLAVELLVTALAAAPGDYRLLCQLARAYLDSDRADRAEETAREASAVVPGGEWAHRLRGLALWRLQDRKGALSAMRQAVEADPLEPLALTHAAWFAGELGEFKQALGLARRLIQLYPDSADSWFAKGWTLVRAQRWSDAEEPLRRSLELAPETSMYHNNLGYALLRQERSEEAIACFERALSLDPENRMALSNLAGALAWNEQFEIASELARRADESALREADAALSDNPELGWAHHQRSLALGHLGAQQDALQAAREAVGCEPANADFLGLLSACEGDGGEEELGEQALQCAIALEPQRCWLRANQAWRAMRRGDARAARRAAEAADRSRPRDSTRLVAWGHVRMAESDWQEAERFYRAAIIPAPIYCCRRVLAGIAAARGGELARAQADLTAARSYRPHCSSVRDLAELLRRVRANSSRTTRESAPDAP